MRICKQNSRKGRPVGSQLPEDIRCLRQSQPFISHVSYGLTHSSSFQIIQWREHHYPSFIQLTEGGANGPGQAIDFTDPRSIIIKLDQSLDDALAKKKRTEDLRNQIGTKSNGATTVQPTGTGGITEVAGYLAIAVFLILGLSAGIVWGFLWYYGEQ